MSGGIHDGEVEPSPGRTAAVNQASRNRLGDDTIFSLDCEKDGADDEDSDPDEEPDEGELEPAAEPNGDEMDGNLAGLTSEEEGDAVPPSSQCITRLRERRGQPSGHRTEHGFHNVGSPVAVRDFDRFGHPILR